MPYSPSQISFPDRFSLAFAAFMERRIDRFTDRIHRLTSWRFPQVGYVFHIDSDAVGMRLYQRLFSAYLERFNNRFSSCRVEDVPELALALEHLPRTEIHNFTMFVIGQLSQDRARFDFHFYEVVSDLLRQLLMRRPFGNEADILRVGEALYFLSPNGYDGILYWPLSAYLYSVRASYGGRRPSESLCEVLEMMSVELCDHFTFGYTAEVTGCRQLIRGLLEGDTSPVPSRQREQAYYNPEENQLSYSDQVLGAVA